MRKNVDRAKRVISVLIRSASCEATAHQKKREEEKSELSVLSVGEKDNSVRGKK